MTITAARPALDFTDLVRWAARLFSPRCWPPYSSRWEQIPRDWSPPLPRGARVAVDELVARWDRRYVLVVIQGDLLAALRDDRRIPALRSTWLELDTRHEAEAIAFLINSALDRLERKEPAP